ncbi:hypothetical protein KP509_12G062700 [Ceratopteris richardii]|uniref:J domain-containing protein n=1 Tax=Ceratopteris richardii TaxID=49495 RepID=A0A8T2TP83_CERRI|nr:hypothetical protein KP509_12G062700 [Ceratopteris richardii]
MRSLVPIHHHLWFSSRKLAEKYIVHAKNLLSSRDPADIHSALGLLDAALKLFPQWDKAIELKARALLCLRRFKDVANMLHDFIPSLRRQVSALHNPVEKLKLLSDQFSDVAVDNAHVRSKGFSQCFPLFKLKKKFFVTRSADRDQWKWLILGQACCQLGMMEDAMILLSNGKRVASTAFRKRSNRLPEDGFYSDAFLHADYDLVSHLLSNVKLLLRRKMVAIAAFEAGSYAESIKHCSKLLEGKRGTPQAFIADCYLLRAKAFQADGRIVDALADCNRTLTLNPLCAEGFNVRATLYETIGCLSDCASDLAQVRSLYGTALQSQDSVDQCWISWHSTKDTDIQGCFNFVSSKLAAVKERLVLDGCSAMDFHAVLGVSRGCCRADIEKAYLLLTLRHRPDKAANFVDRCEFLDERDIDYVKDEAKNLAFKLFQLIQRAYTGIMSVIGNELQRKEITGRKSDAGERARHSYSLEGKLPTLLSAYNASGAGERRRLSCSLDGRLPRILASRNSSDGGERPRLSCNLEGKLQNFLAAYDVNDTGEKSPLSCSLKGKLPNILAACNVLSDSDNESQNVFAIELSVVQ